MKRHVVLIASLGLLCFTVNAQGPETKASEEKTDVVIQASTMASVAESAGPTRPDSKYVPVVAYDPARNADKDIQDALAEATRTKRRVLLEVGGLWCVWCKHMDKFFDNHPDSVALRDKHFITLKINFSDENKNVDVLSRYPKIEGFPHLFVLDSNGKLLRSQDTGDLEEGKGYSAEKFNKFLMLWSTAPAETAPD